MRSSLSHTHAAGITFFYLIFIYGYSRASYLPSHFTFPCTSVASNHKSRANPRVFAVYTLSSYEEHYFLLSSLMSTLCIPICIRRLVVPCFFMSRAWDCSQKRTRVSFRDRAYSIWLRDSLFSFSSAGYFFRTLRRGISPVLAVREPGDAEMRFSIFTNTREASTIWNAACMPK